MRYFSDAINMKCEILVFVNAIKNVLRRVLQIGARQWYIGTWSLGSGKAFYCIDPSAGSQLSAHKFVVGFGTPRALKFEIKFLGAIAIRLERFVGYLRRC
jgi:hypothetical protein